MVEKKKYPRRKFTYFFYNGELHKALHIHQGTDTVTAMNFKQGKVKAYAWSDVRRRGERAWYTRQVAKMVNRSVRTIEQIILDGNIQEPPSTFSLNQNRRKHQYMWDEKSIMELHRYLCTVHHGRPRNDGLITPWPLPSANELRAMLRQETVLYVQTENGFVPTWQANKF